MSDSGIGTVLADRPPFKLLYFSPGGPASQAARQGLLHVGDIVEQINNVPIASLDIVQVSSSQSSAASPRPQLRPRCLSRCAVCSSATPAPPSCFAVSRRRHVLPPAPTRPALAPPAITSTPLTNSQNRQAADSTSGVTACFHQTRARPPAFHRAIIPA